MSRNWFAGNPSTLPPTSECTACQTTILERSDTKIHRELGCIICKQCYGNYILTLRETKNGEGFSLNKIGHQCRCRWCCNDKCLIACTTCRRAFCQGCVWRHDSEADILNVYRLSPDQRVGHTWACFICDTRKQVQLRQEASKFKSDQEAYHEEHRDPNCPSPIQSDDELDEFDLESSSGTEIDEQDAFEQKDSTPIDNHGRAGAETISGEVESIKIKEDEQDEDEKDEDKKDEKDDSFPRARCSYRASNWSIIGHQIKDSKLHFEVRWDGFISDFDTREPVEHVMTNHKELRAYLKKVKEQDCFNFDALIKMAPELADVFRFTASDMTASEFPRACATKEKNKTSKVRSIRVKDFTRASSEQNLASTSESKKRKSPSKSSSSIPEYQSPLKKKAIQTPVTSETGDRNKISGNNSVNVESHGNSKQSMEKRPADRQAQSLVASKSDQMIPGPSNYSVTTSGNEKYLDKPRKNSGTEKSNATHSANQPQPSTDQSPKQRSPIKAKSQASVSSELLVEAGAILANAPTSNGKACEKNTTRASVIVTAEQSTSTASANIVSVGRKESYLARMLDTPSKSPVSKAHSALSASIISRPRASSEGCRLSERPQQETQLIAKTEPVANLPLQVSAGTEIGSQLGDSIRGEQSIVSSATGMRMITEARANAAKTKEGEPNSKISDNAHVQPPVSDTQTQGNAGPRQLAQNQLSSEVSSKKDNQGSTTSVQTAVDLTSKNKTPSDQHDLDYRIPKLKRHYQTSASSQPSKDQLPQTQEKTNNRLQEKTSLPREQSSAVNKTEESNTSIKKTSNYPGNVKAAHRQQQQPLKSFVASNSSSNLRPEKPLASRPIDSKDRHARRKSTDRDASVGTDSSNGRRSSSHSTSRASSRDSYRSTKETILTNYPTKTHSNSKYKPMNRLKGLPVSMRRHSKDEFEPSRDRAYDDNQHSRAPRASWSDSNKTPGSTRREIFSRLDEPHRRPDTLVNNNNNNNDDEKLERDRRKIYGAKPNPYRWNANYVYPSTHHKSWVPHVVQTLLGRIGDYVEPDDETCRQLLKDSKRKVSEQWKNPAGNPTYMIARGAYSIRGSLKYIGSEKRHDDGIETIIQTSAHRLLHVQEKHKCYSIQVFEVKFNGHDETDKLAMSDVLKYDFHAVKRFVHMIAKKNPKRYQAWRKNNHHCYRILCSRSPRQCLRAIEKMETCAYEAYLRDRDIKDLENKGRFEPR